MSLQDKLSFRWSTIKTIATQRFVKSMYIWIFLVPILAKAFEQIGSPIQLVVFSHQFDFVTKLPFSWTLFFYSAVLFVIGNCIFIYQCPLIIRDNHGYSDFRQQGKNIDHLISFAHELKKDPRDLVNWLGENEDMYRGRYLKIEDKSDSDYKIRDVYWHLYAFADLVTPTARMIIQVLYITAIILMAYVFCQNIVTVIKYSISSL